MKSRTFVGFGFGPIQSALFLYEAARSERFSRYVIAEVDGWIVDAVRRNGGQYAINIARPDRIEQALISGVELCNPAVAEHRETILEAIAEGDEIATCLPSVAFYDTGGETSVARTLAAGLARRKAPHPTIIYTAENNNHAAELLLECLKKHSGQSVLDKVQVLNTVIGKMSGVITEPETISRLKLGTLTPGLPKAVLVEEFNRILISRIALPGFRRGIEAFVEKPDLLPFEEAKLYGHNAIHALIGCLAARRGLAAMSDAAAHRDIMGTAEAAFIGECGAALTCRYASLGDPLFTPPGFRAYAMDLLERIVRPTLNDLVSRVVRDLVRKLGYDDRFYGAMRLALGAKIRPVNMARGAAAAVRLLCENWDSAGPASAKLKRPKLPLAAESTTRLLREIWEGRGGAEADTLASLTWEALEPMQKEGCHQTRTGPDA